MQMCVRSAAYLWVNSVRINDAAIVLDDTDAGGAGTGQVAASVQTDIAEALDDERLAAPAGSGADGAHVIGLVDEVLQSVEHAAAGSRDTSMDATCSITHT